jgi:Fe-Mn family superoxide dismutase
MNTSSRPSSDETIGRREALTTMGLGSAAVAGLTGLAACAGPVSAQPLDPQQQTEAAAAALGWDAAAGEYVLPPLPYPYDALEPHIDQQTMRLHHDRHHAGYVRGLNAALAALDEVRRGDRPATEVKHLSRQLAFHGSGHFLHVASWNCMSPSGGGRPSGRIARHIDRDFGSFDQFARHFTSAASSVEGSGWGLLVLEPISGKLMVMQAEKHQNLTAWGVVPLIAIDVWEHAYYLKYQNRRRDYVTAFMNVVNWEYANAALGA